MGEIHNSHSAPLFDCLKVGVQGNLSLRFSLSRTSIRLGGRCRSG